MYNFWVATWSYYKGLYDWLHWRGYIANVIGYPVMMVLLYSLLGRYALDAKMAAFFAIGMAVSTMTYNLISAIPQTSANALTGGGPPHLDPPAAHRLEVLPSRWVVHYPTGLVN